ncbi:MAG: hypothetical protein Kow0069_29850 [Promethearchaeota archaeon]
MHQLSILKRRFVHSSVRYDFHWNKTNHGRLLRNSSAVEVRVLWKYLERIERGDVPNHLFNDRALPRISRFRVKGLRRGVPQTIARKLVESGEVRVEGPEGALPRMVREVFANYEAVGIPRKPGHDAVLKNVLIRDPHSVAVEVPVWRNNKITVTGHVDLLQFREGAIHVLDYKPEGHFIRSLPQVAFYGLLLSRLVKSRELRVRCASFSKDGAWWYSPKVLREDLAPLLERRGLDDLPWIPMLSALSA